MQACNRDSREGYLGRGFSKAFLQSWVTASNTWSLISIMDDGHASTVEYVFSKYSQNQSFMPNSSSSSCIPQVCPYPGRRLAARLENEICGPKASTTTRGQQAPPAKQGFAKMGRYLRYRFHLGPRLKTGCIENERVIGYAAKPAAAPFRSAGL